MESRIIKAAEAAVETAVKTGQRAQPYLKPAVADHVPQYKGIIEGEMKG